MKSLLLIQILISLFLVMLLWQTFRRWQQAILSVAELAGWSILWLTIGVVFWLPNSATKLANILGIGRGADLVTYIAIIFLLFFIYRLTVRIDKIERNLTKVVRQNALKEVPFSSGSDQLNKS